MDVPEVHGPVLTSEVQADICDAFPAERLEQVEQLLSDPSWRRAMLACDRKTLCEIQAVACMQMRRLPEALAYWRACLDFCEACLPPYDESVVAYATQACLCALAAEPAPDTEAAIGLAALAASTHAVAFGGGRPFFLARYDAELRASPLSGAAAMFKQLLEQLPLSEEEVSVAVAETNSVPANDSFDPFAD